MIEFIGIFEGDQVTPVEITILCKTRPNASIEIFSALLAFFIRTTSIVDQLTKFFKDKQRDFFTNSTSFRSPLLRNIRV